MKTLCIEVYGVNNSSISEGIAIFPEEVEKASQALKGILDQEFPDLRFRVVENALGLIPKEPSLDNLRSLCYGVMSEILYVEDQDQDCYEYPWQEIYNRQQISAVCDCTALTKCSITAMIPSSNKYQCSASICAFVKLGAKYSTSEICQKV